MASPSITGPQLTVSAVRGCPEVIANASQVISAAPGSGTVMVPAQPDGGLVCRYSAWGTHADQRLLASARLTAASAANLATLLDRLPELRGTVACPADSGARDIVALTYAHHASATAEIHLGGCGAVVNGWFGRIATPALSDALAAQVGSATPRRAS